jgi:hypothetical protein
MISFGPPEMEALWMSYNGVVHNGYIAHLGHLTVGHGGNTSYRGIKDKIVPDDSIRNNLNCLTTVPHHIPLDKVNFASSTIDKDTWVLLADIRVMNDIIANDVPIGACFNLNTIVSSITRTTQVVDVIAFNEGIGRPADVIGAANIYPFTFGRARGA